MMIEKEKESKLIRVKCGECGSGWADLDETLHKVECRGCGCEWWMTADDLSDWDSPESVECQECI